MYRKAALKIVTDLGEEELPEAKAQLTTASQDNATAVDGTVHKSEAEPSQEVSSPRPEEASASESSSAQSAEDKSSQSAENKTAEDASSKGEGIRTTTTKVRKPMAVPKDVHVKITSDNLVDYVGPPIYQKDRIYTQTTPAGVSTGLGYLGNGSGSCLPIEATVSYNFLARWFDLLSVVLRSCQGAEASL